MQSAITHKTNTIMANEKENIKKEENENQEDQKKHTWMGDLIESAINNIDGDFPLSGGEEPHHSQHKTDEEIEEEKKKEEEKKATLKHDLNIDFPLSGGEQ